MKNNIRIYRVKSEYINKEKEPSYRYLLQAESREISRQKNRIRKNAEIV